MAHIENNKDFFINEKKISLAENEEDLDISLEMLIGKRLSQSIIDMGSNDGSKTSYTISLQSAYRLAYMSLVICTDTNGIIKNYDYSTYLSTGSACGDMISRPKCIDDREDEVEDVLSYLLDSYTDEEKEKLF